MPTNIADLTRTLSERSLDDNIRDLTESFPTQDHIMLQMRYNNLLDSFFKGLITRETFDTANLNLWDAFFFFVKKQRGDKLEQFAKQTGVANTAVKSILFAAAVPKGVAGLQTNTEFNKVKQSIESGTARDSFQLLLPLLAITLDEFLREKHKHKPTIIHFSGHGSTTGLMFATDQNDYKMVTTEVLKEVFKGAGSFVECVVLNACYASVQAEVISANGIYVIGMNRPITDPAAIFLSQHFYRFLGDGLPVKEAFDQTRIMMLSEFKGESNTPVLWKNGQEIKS